MLIQSLQESPVLGTCFASTLLVLPNFKVPELCWPRAPRCCLLQSTNCHDMQLIFFWKARDAMSEPIAAELN